MQNWLANVHKNENKTAVFVTHSIDEAIFLSDRVIVLNNGKSKEFKVNFPRPRNALIKFDKKFLELKKELAKHIE